MLTASESRFPITESAVQSGSGSLSWQTGGKNSTSMEESMSRSGRPRNTNGTVYPRNDRKPYRLALVRKKEDTHQLGVVYRDRLKPATVHQEFRVLRTNPGCGGEAETAVRKSMQDAGVPRLG